MGHHTDPDQTTRTAPPDSPVGSSGVPPRLLRCDYCGTETDIEWTGVRIEEVRCRACHEREEKR